MTRIIKMAVIEIDRNKKWYRAWEIFPGALTWSVFILPAVLCFFWPVFVGSLIILYALYWLIKSMLMSGRLIVGYRRYCKDVKIDWLKRLENEKIKKSFSQIYHLMIMATYKEELEILRHSVGAAALSKYPLKKIIFVLGLEERDKTRALKNAEALQKEFGNKFFHFAVVMHPKDLPNEVAGKGSNIVYAAKQIKKFIDQKNIPYGNIIVTNMDADHRVHPNYLANLTYAYLTDEDSKHKSYQPIPMFFNNIWDVPIPMRSISVGSTFWQMIESTQPYRLRNFAAHSQSFEALVETNFWSKLTIVEDGHQYWRSYFRFDGNYHVVPIFTPVYQDAVLSPKGYMATFKEQYLQKRRWAWGSSDIPYVMTTIIGNKKLPFWDKWMQAGRLIEGHFSWATTSIILAVVGWLPAVLNPAFRETVFAYNFSLIYSRLLTFAMLGLIVTLTISTLMLPPRPKKFFNFSIILEWIISPVLLPISNIVFSSFAAIDAQTRLLLGKYLGFRVTEKKAVCYGESNSNNKKISN